MNRSALVAILAAGVALGGCQTARVGGVPPAGIPGPGAGYNAPEPILEEIPPALVGWGHAGRPGEIRRAARLIPLSRYARGVALRHPRR